MTFLSFRKAFSSGQIDPPSSYHPPRERHRTSSSRKASISSVSSTSTIRPAPLPPPPLPPVALPLTSGPASPTRFGSLAKSRVGKLRKDFGSLGAGRTGTGRRLFGSIGTLGLGEKVKEDWVVLPRHSSCPPTPTITITMGQNQTKPAPLPERKLAHSASQSYLLTITRPRMPEPPVSAPILSTQELYAIHVSTVSSAAPLDESGSTVLAVPRAIPRVQPSSSDLPVLTPGAPPSSFTDPRDFSPDTSIGAQGTLGKKSFGLAGRLARKGSRRSHTSDGAKPPPFGHGSKKASYSDDLAKFEAAVVSAETKGHYSSPSPPVESTPVVLPSVLMGRSKRHSLSDPPLLNFGHGIRPSTAGADTSRSMDSSRAPPFGHAMISSKTPRPHASHHRRSSNSSVVSEKSSIKLSRRAELEWRARVAALTSGHGATPRNSVITGRGPVPPKRARPAKPTPATPAPFVKTQDISFASSIDSDKIITPPRVSATGSSSDNEPELSAHSTHSVGQVEVVEKVVVPQTPARSFQSGRSFDTLGIHRPTPPSSAALDLTPRTSTVHRTDHRMGQAVDVPRSVGSHGHSISPIPQRLTGQPKDHKDHSDMVDRMRKVSVPLSISSLGRSVSSFCFDNNGTHVSESTRPNSTVLSDSALGSASTGNPSADESKLDEVVERRALLDHPSAPNGLVHSDPSGDIEELDNVSSAAELKAAKALSANCQSIEELTPTSRPNRHMIRLSDPAPSTTPTVSSIPRLSSGPTQAPQIATHSRSSSTHVSSSCDPLARLMCTPQRQARQAQTQGSISTLSVLSTPYSPTTNFLLTAPIESLPWNLQAGDETPEKKSSSHPFARGVRESIVESITGVQLARSAGLSQMTENAIREDVLGQVDKAVRQISRPAPNSPLRSKVPLAPSHAVAAPTPPRSDSLRRKEPAATARQADVFTSKPVVPLSIKPPITSFKRVIPSASIPNPVAKAAISSMPKPAVPTTHAAHTLPVPPLTPAPQATQPDTALRVRRQVPANVQVTIPSTKIGLFKRQKSSTRLQLDGQAKAPSLHPHAVAQLSRARAHVHAPAGASSVLKSQLLGSPARRTYANVDLTPGMDNGERPPKTGLPMADLHRWLRESSTTITA